MPSLGTPTRVLILGGGGACPRQATRGAAGALPQCCGQAAPALAQPPWAPGMPGLPSSPALSGSRRLEQRGSAWPPRPWAPGSELGCGARAWRPAALCPSSCAECRLCRVGQASQPCPGRPSALQGSWADACLGEGRAIAPAPALCPARPFGGHWLASPLCAGSPPGPPASPAQLLPDVRGVVCLGKRPAGQGSYAEGCGTGRPPPAPSHLLHLPLMVTGLQVQSQFLMSPVHPTLWALRVAAHHPDGGRLLRGGRPSLRSLALLPHKPPGSLAVLW